MDADRAAPQHIQLFALTAGLFCYIERFSCLSGRPTVIRGAFCHFERGEKSGQQIPPVAVLPRKDSLCAGAPRKNKQGGAACPVLLCRSLVSRRTGSAGGAVPACARGDASVFPGQAADGLGALRRGHAAGGRPAGYAVRVPRRHHAGTAQGPCRTGTARPYSFFLGTRMPSGQVAGLWATASLPFPVQSFTTSPLPSLNFQ